MKKKIFFLFATAFFLYIQTSPFLPFGKNGIRPDLFFIFVIFLGVNFSAINGSVICFLLGYTIKIFSGTNSGLYPIIYLSVFFTIRVLLKYFSFDTISKLIILLFVCFFIKFFIIFFSFCFIYEYSYSLFRKIFLLESFYTLVFSPFVFLLLLKIGKDKKETSYFFGSEKNVS